jgi:hypothetical protein
MLAIMFNLVIIYIVFTGLYLSNFTAYVIFGTPPKEYEGLIHRI